MTEALPTIPAGKYCFITPEIKKKISFTSVFYQSSWFHIQDFFFFFSSQIYSLPSFQGFKCNEF